MARENQLLVDDERSEYFCSPCRRSFSSARGAMQHAATAAIHRDEWCYDCDWLFVNPDALENHLSHSSQHGNNHHHREREENNRTHNRRRRSSDHECTVCGEVYSHPDDLAEVRAPKTPPCFKLTHLNSTRRPTPSSTSSPKRSRKRKPTHTSSVVSAIANSMANQTYYSISRVLLARAASIAITSASWRCDTTIGAA